MRKRFWLFALLLALCLVLTGCRKTVSAPPAAPGSTFAAAPANDAPATVADFDAALKAAGFIDEDEYDAISTAFPTTQRCTNNSRRMELSVCSPPAV